MYREEKRIVSIAETLFPSLLYASDTDAPAAESVPAETTAHVHAYAETVEIPAKTFAEGVKRFACACGDSYTEPIPATGRLEVLAVGNSFSTDAMQYLWDIAHNGGVTEIVLGNLFVSGCSLAEHVAHINTDAAVYTYYKNTADKWDSEKKVTVLHALEDEEWDIITLQQASRDSGVPSSYAGYLDTLIAYLEKHEPQADLYWHMTWAYQQDSTHRAFVNYGSDQMTMYTAIADAVKTAVLPHPSIRGVIPVGTALQNLRASYVGDAVTRDGQHLNYTVGRYTAAMTWLTFFTGKSPDTVPWVPAAHAEGVTPHLQAVREAVTNAIAAPLCVTAPQ